MIILYIPFSVQEGPKGLSSTAMTWQTVCRIKQKDSAVIFHNDYYWRSIAEILEVLMLGQCKIYILAHGTYQNELLISIKEAKNVFITPQELARRFSQDFQIPNFHPGNKIKLFFCDFILFNKAWSLATVFQKNLSTPFSQTEIFYYPSIQLLTHLCNPNTKKYAKGAIAAFSSSSEFFDMELIVFLGNPKPFRVSLKDKRASFFSCPPQPTRPLQGDLIQIFKIQFLNMIAVNTSFSQKHVKDIFREIPPLNDPCIFEYRSEGEGFQLNVRVRARSVNPGVEIKHEPEVPYLSAKL